MHSIASEPAQPLAEPPLISDAERRRLLEDWNATRVEYPANETVATLFEAQAARTASASAVTHEGISLSYGRLNAQANQLARHLQRRGVAPGVLVGICVERSPWMIVGLLGILKAGGAYVPLDPAFPRERLRFMLEDSRASLLVTHKPLLAALPGNAPDAVCLDSDWAEIAQEAACNPERSAKREGLAYVLYTSGSTGNPKGVEIPHRALTNFLCAMRVTPGFTERDTLLALTTLSFDIAGLELYLPLIAGGRVELASREVAADARLLSACIERCRPTMMQATPATWRMLVEAGWEGSPGLTALCGGESMPLDLASQLGSRTGTLWNMYGPTETTVWSSLHRVLPGDDEITIGRPIANTRFYILDRQLQLLPIGVPGELFIDGDGLALGYRNQPGLSAERFIAHPFSNTPGARLYRTGDLARYREDGNVVHLGRLDFQVKVSGYRIELGEIETALMAHDSLAQAVVMAREDQPGVTTLAAYVVPSSGHALVVTSLRGYLQARLPEYMIPQHFVALPALPLTLNGKIDRKQLPAPQPSRPALAVRYVAAASSVQVALTSIWELVLGVHPVGMDDNFFDLGGTSLLAVRMLEQVERTLGRRVSIGQAFANPSVRGLDTLLQGAQKSPPKRTPGDRSGSEDIAIVGMAGRFPGCRNLQAYWQLLCDGCESITFFKDSDIHQSIDRRTLLLPNYVKARGVVDDADCFDAGFFGINPKEADVIDPQQRQLLEVAWHALEDAGIHGKTLEEQSVAVFAGVGDNAYYRRNLWGNPAVKEHGEFRLRIANEKDYVATRIAYAIGLHGPAVNVQTACSTSLVAVSRGMQSLRMGESDVALCGGASIPVPQNSGHEYNEGSAHSSDGHCRPYDADASGTVFSSGVGMVVLMRHDQALAQGRRVYAVLKGSGVNNDGGGKMSFMAPSVEGQARVLAQALDDARLAAADVTYIEGHGTATPLGDPMEAEALATVYGDPQRPVYLGSVKGNIGHTDAAAGIAGLIKTALALHHRQLPPSINFLAPNPRIPLDLYGLEVNTRLRPWPQDRPLCAAVTSLGVGGTNAHVILAAAEAQEERPESTEPQLLLFSGKTEAAAAQINEQVLLQLQDGAQVNSHVNSQVNSPVYAAAATLAHHRQHFSQRRFQVVDAGSVLAELPRGGGESRSSPSIAFMFPGQGSQYPRMGERLYQTYPIFRNTIDRCADILQSELGCDVRTLLYPENHQADTASGGPLDQTQFTQPLLFSMAIALNELWQSWGLRPAALVGHSIGEYAAACVAGVMGIEDALRLVSRRGSMMAALPAGAMLSVGMPVKDLTPLLGPELAIAAVNGPQSCVASGTHESIATLRQALAGLAVQCRVLRTSHAFHSPMMDPVLPAFQAEVAKVKLSPPRVPIMSTVTAQWLTDEAAISPAYWARQLRMPVRFAEAIQALWTYQDYLALELGPRATASTLARCVITDRRKQMAVPSMGDSPEREQASLLGAVGQLWACGADVDIGAIVPKAPPIPLPGYPFARDRHWIEPAVPEPRDTDGIRTLLREQQRVLRNQVDLLEQRYGDQSLARITQE